MKATPQEGQQFSDAIDLVNNGIETIINLYNDLEPNQPVIEFDETVLALIEKVKDKYGDAFVDKKVNSVVKELLEWLPLDEEEPNGKGSPASLPTGKRPMGVDKAKDKNENPPSPSES